ncbi:MULTISPECIES: TetR/AcrR family transcriptional regulator [Streptomyces]|uniref:TetR/AcrR family transcriptional regulator n=1 Tax=Streptomyces dengpaensis TaxID=2049881 RepID=A0ABM6STW0_9ACTN|nr:MULTISPECIES: TetR/AcrR family transcriptional regulator [Streptomyces]AVH57928.1 TetR/AcrR family transcriptional regulator [Streptomyces dengpaensis]PIB06576.1 TetR family transcriptional regulator [Streptomyces sp. HG99]
MVRMPTTRPYHHGDLRAALLTSAERTLREKGVAALSLRELARDVGVSHAAPGRHFKDKQALLDALTLVGFERMARAMDAADDPELPLERRLTALAKTYLGFAIENAELLELMFARKHDPDVSAQLTAAVDRSAEPITRLISDAQQRGEIIEGDPERITMVAAASLHGLAAFTANGSLPAEASLAGLDEHIHHLLHGLRPR